MRIIEYFSKKFGPIAICQRSSIFKARKNAQFVIKYLKNATFIKIFKIQFQKEAAGLLMAIHHFLGQLKSCKRAVLQTDLSVSNGKDMCDD